MFFRTHLVIVLFFILMFFQDIHNPLLFLPIAIFSTLFPDIDNKFSKIGHYKIFRIFNFFIKHRGAVHSFTFLAIAGVFIFLFFRKGFSPFVFGYSLHLILDSITISGIKPFYPLKLKVKGKIRTGGVIENFSFIVFLLVDLFLIFNRIYAIF